MKTRRIHYGWVICALCTLMMFCSTGLSTTAYSVYQPYVIAERGFTYGGASSIILVRSVSALLTIMIADRMIAHFGLRACASASLVLIAAGFFIYGISARLYQYWIGALIVGVAYGMGGMVTASVAVNRWFVKRRGTAVGVCSAGTAAATMITPPLISFMIERVSLSFSYLAEAAFMLVCGLAVMCFMRSFPRDMGLEPYGEASGGEHVPVRQGVSLPDHDRHIITAAAFALGTVSSLITNHMSTIFTSNGMDSSAAALLISVQGAMLLIMKFVYGALVDRFGAKRINVFFMGSMLAGGLLYCLSFTGSFLIAAGAAALMGAGLPLSTVGLSMMAADFSDAAHFPKIMRLCQSAYSSGMLVSTFIPGMLTDLTGSYLTSLILGVIMILTFSALTMRTYIKYR